jgi:hypothetical protein
MTQGWSFICILIFPDSKKDRLPETVIPRPFREFYLANLRRFDPTATLHFRSSQTLVPAAPTGCRDVEKGTGIDPDLLQFRIETAQKFIAKAGSNSASKFAFLAFVACALSNKRQFLAQVTEPPVLVNAS